MENKLKIYIKKNTFNIGQAYIIYVPFVKAQKALATVFWPVLYHLQNVQCID